MASIGNTLHILLKENRFEELASLIDSCENKLQVGIAVINHVIQIDGWWFYMNKVLKLFQMGCRMNITCADKFWNMSNLFIMSDVKKELIPVYDDWFRCCDIALSSNMVGNVNPCNELKSVIWVAKLNYKAFATVCESIKCTPIMLGVIKKSPNISFIHWACVSHPEMIIEDLKLNTDDYTQRADITASVFRSEITTFEGMTMPITSDADSLAYHLINTNIMIDVVKFDENIINGVINSPFMKDLEIDDVLRKYSKRVRNISL